MQLTLDMVVPVMTVVVSYIMGILAKKFNWYKSKYIPIQNAIIGIVSAIIFTLARPETDFVTVLFTVLSGFVAGGMYDFKKKVGEK